MYSPSLTQEPQNLTTSQSLEYVPFPLPPLPQLPEIRCLTIPQPSRIHPRNPDRRRRNNRLRPNRLRSFSRSRLHSRRPLRSRRLQDFEQTAIRCRARAAGQYCLGRKQYSPCAQVGQASAYWVECFGYIGAYSIWYGVSEQDSMNGLNMNNAGGVQRWTVGECRTYTYFISGVSRELARKQKKTDMHACPSICPGFLPNMQPNMSDVQDTVLTQSCAELRLAHRPVQASQPPWGHSPRLPR